MPDIHSPELPIQFKQGSSWKQTLRFASYLNGVVVGLARFAVGLVGHEPGLQQVLVETVAKPSDRGVICVDGWKETRL